jgi:hypothetical protein
VPNREGVKSIDALKIDVDHAEHRILMPFFRTGPASLWPRFILIEDDRDSWRTDLFSVLAERGYLVWQGQNRRAHRSKGEISRARASAKLKRPDAYSSPPN